ncbi:hypothetical protein D7X48_11285 [bacterium D16-50]|nr:hypothetical protein D7X48_11285 [bacterium D16-50]
MVMNKNSKDFVGMLITLKKRMMCINVDDTNDYQYLMFGHYDGMDIHCTNQWYQLRPKGVEKYGGNVDISDSLWDKYTLKLYFPPKKYCEELERKGFGYDIWQKLGCFQENRDYCNDVLRHFPFVSVAMINLSKKCVEEGELINELEKIIYDAVSKELKIDLSSIHCAIMPSMGYADFVLLFLSDNLTKVITVLDYLRQVAKKDKRDTYAVLSNSYAISGFAKVGLEKLKGEGRQEGRDVNLSIRVNLRDGVSAEQFEKYFSEQIKMILKESPQQKTVKNPDLYQVFGNSDCLILSDMSFDFFIPLFYDGKLLNPEHELFRDYVRHTRSSIRVKITGKGTNYANSNSGKGAQEKYQEEFQKLIGCLRKYAKDQNMPMRTINGLQNVMKTYLNLVQFSHCFDIERIIGDAFKAVKNNVEKTMEMIKEGEEETVFWYSEQIMVALRIFRDKTEEYLADMLRSDRLFIEGQSLSHPSIGSATKLLFFYNKFLDDVAEKLLDNEEREKGNRYTFVVTSGGCDVTTACDVFSYIDPSEAGNHSLIIISVPEMSLYDIRGTMFRVLHECFHFCGERKRNVRLQALRKSVSVNVALTICEGLRKSLEMHFTVRILGSLQKKIPKAEWERAKYKGLKIIQKEMEHLVSLCADRLCKELEEKICLQDCPDMLYGRKLYSHVAETLKREILMLDELNAEECFLRYVYNKFFICQKQVAEEIILYFKNINIPFSKADILKETAEHKLCMESMNRFDQSEIQLIYSLFRAIAGEVVFEKTRVEIGKEEELTVDDIIDILASLFKECFADCMAAKMLKLSMEDFVLCFIYETWNGNYVFSDHLRMAVELKVLYGIEGKMTDKHRENIENKMLHWEEQGFCYEREEGYVDEVCRKIDGVLKEYNEGGYVGIEPLEQYLAECLKFYDEGKFREEAALGELAGMSSCDDIHKLLDEVQGKWKNMAIDRKDCDQ